MPPDVVAGFVVVVVGAVVVVVVVLGVVVVTEVAAPLPSLDRSVVLVVVVLDAVEVLAARPEELPAVVREDEFRSLRTCVALPPGCSVATTRPITTLAPVAPSTAPKVSRRSRDLALALSSRGPFGVRPMAIGLLGLANDFQETMHASAPSQWLLSVR